MISQKGENSMMNRKTQRVIIAVIAIILIIMMVLTLIAPAVGS